MHKELGLVGEKNKKGKKVMKLYLKKVITISGNSIRKKTLGFGSNIFFS